MSKGLEKITRKNLFDAVKHLRRLRRTESDQLNEKQQQELTQAITQLEEAGGTRHGIFSWLGWLLAWPFLQISHLLGYSNPEPAPAAYSGGFSQDSARPVLARAESIYGRLTPRGSSSTLREWTDVILVAAVVALGVRSYYIQPFKIPTNSMYPTLRGVVVTALPSEEALPAQWQRWTQHLLMGRVYYEIDLPADSKVDVQAMKQSGAWLMQRLHLRFVAPTGEVRVQLPTEMTPRDFLGSEVMQQVNFPEARTLRFMVETGDHLFVNKVLYHFRKPDRGDSFVFRTLGLDTTGDNRPVTDPLEGSQFYIKRCVAVGNDLIRLDPPKLYINGEIAPEPAIQRVWLGAEPGHKDYNPAYHGYFYGKEQHRMPYLTPGRPSYKLPPDTYWAMGDNSDNSLDSRLFGPVPLENVVGKAMVIYYPFNRLFKLIE